MKKYSADVMAMVSALLAVMFDLFYLYGHNYIGSIFAVCSVIAFYYTLELYAKEA